MKLTESLITYARKFGWQGNRSNCRQYPRKNNRNPKSLKFFLRRQRESPLMNLPTYADIVAAAPVVHRFLKPTPLYEWPALSQLLGCRFFLKHENHTPTTAFKVRGGIYLVSRLTEEQKSKGVIACTTGNHGQSLAYACRLFDVRCVMVVPAKNNPDKVAAMKALGAQVIDQ